MIRTEDIRPLSEHRANISEDIRHVQETGRPLFITTNGRTAGVLLSPAAYDKLAEQAMFVEDIAAIREALQELNEGKGIEAKQALREIAAKLGLNLNR